MSVKLDFNRLTVKELTLFKSKQECEIPLYDELYDVALKINGLLEVQKCCMKGNGEYFNKKTPMENPDGVLGFLKYLISEIDSHRDSIQDLVTYHNYKTFFIDHEYKTLMVHKGGSNQIKQISTSVDSKSRKRKPKPTYEEKLKELPRKLDERKMNTDESLEDFERYLTVVKKEFDAFYHETIDEMYEEVMKWYEAKRQRKN